MAAGSGLDRLDGFVRWIDGRRGPSLAGPDDPEGITDEQRRSRSSHDRAEQRADPQHIGDD